MSLDLSLAYLIIFRVGISHYLSLAYLTAFHWHISLFFVGISHYLSLAYLITFHWNISLYVIKPDYKIGISCFSAKHATLRRKNKDWLPWNHDNVSEWGEMSINELLFHLASTIKIQQRMLVFSP
jgi:hypothetical protein